MKEPRYWKSLKPLLFGRFKHPRFIKLKSTENCYFQNFYSNLMWYSYLIKGKTFDFNILTSHICATYV